MGVKKTQKTSDIIYVRSLSGKNMIYDSLHSFHHWIYSADVYLTYLCVDLVIWTGCQILKLASIFEMFIYFFVFCRIKKKDELLCNIFY